MRVAICGAGVVGGGVISILSRPQHLESGTASTFRITKVLVRNASRERDFLLPQGASYTEDWKECLKEVDMVVELIGGVTLAKEIVFAALRAGLRVVTANKALLAGHMEELEDIMASVPQARLAYEASVGGGIPVIRTLQSSIISADSIKKISGILNGTTNYMLSKMASEGSSYGDVLKEAQSLGYAEADPTADVEGYDARAKISVLCRLALGKRVSPEDIPCVGITRLTAEDFDYAQTLKSTIKLVAVAQKVTSASGENIQAFVSPCICPMSSIVANINGATNVVEVESESLGVSHLLGAGAGRFPTANSVVADMIAIGATDAISSAFPIPLKKGVPFDKDFVSRFYIRLRVCDQTGIIMTSGALCHNFGISIHSVLQNPIVDPANVPFVITTESCTHSQVEEFCETVSKETWCLEKPLAIPLMI